MKANTHFYTDNYSNAKEPVGGGRGCDVLKIAGFGCRGGTATVSSVFREGTFNSNLQKKIGSLSLKKRLLWPEKRRFLAEAVVSLPFFSFTGRHISENFKKLGHYL